MVYGYKSVIISRERNLLNVFQGGASTILVLSKAKKEFVLDLLFSQMSKMLLTKSSACQSFKEERSLIWTRLTAPSILCKT